MDSWGDYGASAKKKSAHIPAGTQMKEIQLVSVGFCNVRALEFEDLVY